MNIYGWLTTYFQSSANYKDDKSEIWDKKNWEGRSN